MTTFILAALSIGFMVGTVWAAIWAWLTFRVSIFAWLVAGRISHLLMQSLDAKPDRASLDRAVADMPEKTGIDIVDLYFVYSEVDMMLSLWMVIGFSLIAISEVSHMGQKCIPSYRPPSMLPVVYRLRHYLGVLTLGTIVMPPLLLYFWMQGLA